MALGGNFPYSPQGLVQPLVPRRGKTTRGPWSSVQRMTLQVTPTVATGAGSLHISHPPAQSLIVTFEHLNSL